MRNNRRTRNYFNEEKETRKLIYISIAVVIVAILVFAVTYIAYSNILSNNKQTGDITSKIAEFSSIQNEESSQASSSIGKNVNEMSSKQDENINKIAINTANMEKQNETEKNENITKENKVQSVETPKQTEKVADPTFIKPVEGEVLKEFANENLIFSETLKEWVTHNGIDIKAQKASIVKVAAEGTVKSIKNDPRYGITIVVEHVNGYVSIYSNLLTAEFVKEGENVKQGQTIGTVGNTAIFEISDETHLHFELLKNNEYLNPSEYIK